MSLKVLPKKKSLCNLLSELKRQKYYQKYATTFPLLCPTVNKNNCFEQLKCVCEFLLKKFNREDHISN